MKTITLFIEPSRSVIPDFLGWETRTKRKIEAAGFEVLAVDGGRYTLRYDPEKVSPADLDF